MAAQPIQVVKTIRGTMHQDLVVAAVAPPIMEVMAEGACLEVVAAVHQGLDPCGRVEMAEQEQLFLQFQRSHPRHIRY
jgi:hypothetical protein